MQENDVIKKTILEAFEILEVATSIKDLQASFDELGTSKFTNQKISALIKQLVESGLLVRIEEKRIAKFSIAK